jgi:hypothetical protein
MCSVFFNETIHIKRTLYSKVFSWLNTPYANDDKGYKTYEFVICRYCVRGSMKSMVINYLHCYGRKPIFYGMKLFSINL